MKKLSITKAGFTEFPNAMHVELHTKIDDYIKQYGAEKLGLNAQAVQDYEASIEKEQNYVNHSYASIFTPEIVKARDVRDRYYRYVRQSIKVARLSQDSKRVAAYTALKTSLLDVYPPMGEMADGQNATAQIRGFVSDAQSDDNSSYIEALGLTEFVQKLYNANETFATKYLTRNTERAEAVPAEMKLTRTQSDSLYRTLAYTIQAQALLTSSDADQQKTFTKCAALAAEIGILLGDWQTRLRLSRKGYVVAPEAGSEEDVSGTDTTSGDESSPEVAPSADAATPADTATLSGAATSSGAATPADTATLSGAATEGSTLNESEKEAA
jgi:hypothetical protein